LELGAWKWRCGQVLVVARFKWALTQEFNPRFLVGFFLKYENLFEEMEKAIIYYVAGLLKSKRFPSDERTVLRDQ